MSETTDFWTQHAPPDGFDCRCSATHRATPTREKAT
jgi:uncharacterized protein with gpF-like domain